MRVKRLRIRLVPIVAVAASLLLLLAAPAGASTTVVADDTYKWFYWIGPILALSFVGWLLMMAVGYYTKVLRPRHRGQKQS